MKEIKEKFRHVRVTEPMTIEKRRCEFFHAILSVDSVFLCERTKSLGFNFCFYFFEAFQFFFSFFCFVKKSADRDAHTARRKRRLVSVLGGSMSDRFTLVISYKSNSHHHRAPRAFIVEISTKQHFTRR